MSTCPDQGEIQPGLPRIPAEPPTSASPVWRVWLAAWMVAAVFMLSNAPTPLYIHWQQAMEFSSATLTMIFSAYIVGLIAALVIAGQLSDRIGRRRVLIPGISAALIACLLFAVADSVPELLVARFLSGVAVGVIVSAGMASVADAGGKDHKRLASLAASVAMVTGSGVGPLLAATLLESLDHPIVPIFATEAFVLFTGLLIANALDFHEPVRSSVPDRWRPRIPAVPRKNRPDLAFGIAAFAPGLAGTSFVLSLGPSLLAGQLDVRSPLIAGGTACVMFLSATGVQLLLSHLRVRSVLLLSTLATLAAMASMGVAVHASLAMLLAAAGMLAGAGQGLGQLGGLRLIALHVPDNRRAESNALLNMSAYVFAGTLPVLTGYLIDVTDLATGTSAFSLGISVVAIVAAVFIATRLGADE